jgi:hypothetical protein
MSHFAKLDANNIVTFVTVGRQEDDGQEAALTARTGMFTSRPHTTPAAVFTDWAAHLCGRTTQGLAIPTMLVGTHLFPPNPIHLGC